MMEVELVSCSTGDSIVYCDVKKICQTPNSLFWEVTRSNRTELFEFEWYQLKRCEAVESVPEVRLTAEEVAKNFGMESNDDFMTALRETMDEEY